MSLHPLEEVRVKISNKGHPAFTAERETAKCRNCRESYFKDYLMQYQGRCWLCHHRRIARAADTVIEVERNHDNG